MIGLAAGIEMADMAWEVKCREEDMKQRALENERHAIDDARRSVDEKAQQLKVLANQSALIAGFSMVVLVESSIPDNINSVLLTLFGGVTAITIALMLVSTLNSTYILVAILRYDCVERSVPFDVFWRRRCETDWKLALRSFSFGVPSFMIVVAFVAWVSFWNHPSRYYSASVVTAISIMLTIFWFANTQRKWGDFLLMSEARILTRGMSFGAESIKSSRSSKRKDDEEGGSSKDDDSSIDLRDSLQLSSLAIGELSESEMNLDKKRKLKG